MRHRRDLTPDCNASG